MIFFKRKEAEKRDRIEGIERREMNLDELERWIKEKSDPNLGSVKSQVEQITRNFGTILNNLKKLGNDLRGLKISTEDIAPQYITAINKARQTLVSVIENESKEPLPEIRHVDDLMNLHERIRRLMSKLGTSGAHSKVIHNFLPAQARVLKTELMALKNESDTLDRIINEYTARTSSLSSCSNLIAKIKRSEIELKDIEKKYKELCISLEGMKKEKEQISNKLESLKNSQEYIESANALSAAMQEYNTLLAKINSDFSRIARALNKYMYEIGLEKEKSNIVRSIFDDPANIANIDPDVMKEIFAKVIESIRSGRVQLKNAEKDIEYMQYTMEKIPDYVKSSKEYSNRLSQSKERVMPYDSLFANLSNDLNNVNIEIARTESMISEIRKKIEGEKDTRDRSRKELEESMKKLGYDIKIT